MNGLPRLQTGPGFAGVMNQLAAYQQAVARDREKNRLLDIQAGERQLDRQEKAFELAKELIGGVKDEETYRAARGIYGGYFPDFVNQIPEDYDESFIRALQIAWLGPQKGEKTVMVRNTVTGAVQEVGESVYQGWELQAPQLYETLAERETAQKREEPQTNIGKLIAERNRLGKDDPRRSIYDRAIEKTTAQTGMVLETTPGGGLTFRTGVPMGEEMAGLTKTTQTRMEQKQFEAGEGLARLNEISQQFRPEYQEVPTRLRAAYSRGKEKLGFRLSESEQNSLAQYASYRRMALDNINRYIKEITGAQMSEKEAERLTRGMPNPGQGVVDGDSPTEFWAKLRDTMRTLALAQARYHFIRKHGLSIYDVSIEKIPQILNKRGKEIEAEIRQANPGISQADLEIEAQARLNQEFGGGR